MLYTSVNKGNAIISKFPDAVDYPTLPAASPSFVSGGQQVFEFVRMMACSEVYLRCPQLANASRVLGNLAKITLKSGVAPSWRPALMTGTSWLLGAPSP